MLQTLAEFQSGEGQVVEHVDGVGEDNSFIRVEQTVEPRPASNNINTGCFRVISKSKTGK